MFARIPPGYLLLLLLGAAARADVLYLESGGRIEGRIVHRDASSVEIHVGAGTMTFPISAIARIEEGRSVLDDYDEQRKGLADDDLDGWVALGDWSASNGLGTQAKAAYRHVLQQDPQNPAANAAMGNIELDGVWMSPDEAYLAQGYVLYEGQWMLPEDRDAIELQRREQATAEQARDEARAAEARARDAESRARDAEAAARKAQEYYDDGYPYWDPWPVGPPYRPVHPPPRPEPEPEPEPVRPIRVPLRR